MEINVNKKNSCIFSDEDRAWINQYPCEIEQVDGTRIMVLLTGDEFHSWYHDENSFTIIQGMNTGDYYWAVETSHHL